MSASSQSKATHPEVLKEKLFETAEQLPEVFIALN